MSLSNAKPERPPRSRAAFARWKQWSREPLLHFLLGGLILFAIYQILHPKSGARENPRRIELTTGDLQQLGVSWLAQGRPPPSSDELRKLLETKVREEVLYREALALGLDKDDEIIKRRLAQKMGFLIEDLAGMREPTRDELRAWFSKDPGRFALEPRLSFRQLYFSPDHRGAHAREDAVTALAQIAGEAVDAPIATTLGDPFFFQDTSDDHTPDQLLRMYGPNFAKVLFQLKPGSWQGPVESGYGWHLVWINDVVPDRIPNFEEVESDVKSAWLSDWQNEVERKAYEAMRARYTIVLPPLDKLPTPPSVGAPSGAAPQAARAGLSPQ